MTYSPVLDVVRDPRWGRTEECFAEDPYLIGELAVAAVEGLQGERLDSPHTIAATLKHFAAYGSSEGGRNAAPVHMGMRELHEIDLLPFKKAVEAGACSVMTAYNEIDGVPCTSSTYLLNDVLREQWGFEGVVITDFGAIQMLVHGHNTAENGEQAAAQALRAGVDMEMSGYMFRKHLKQALEQGFMAEHDLDQAVSRVLELKFRLGLFEQPFVDPAFAERVIGCEAHKELARQVAREGIVLLKNENGTLPLAKKGIHLPSSVRMPTTFIINSAITPRLSRRERSLPYWRAFAPTWRRSGKMRPRCFTRRAAASRANRAKGSLKRLTLRSRPMPS